MPQSIKDAGVWKAVKRHYYNNAGTWIEPKEIHIKDAGTWKKFHQVITVSASTRNFNVYTACGNPTTKVNVVVIVNSGVVIGSTSTSTAAFDTGALPAGSTVYLINNGTISGKGGDGGPGFGGDPYSSGLPGGNAINATVPMIIQNNGTIQGGGGGGAGGAYWPGHAAAIGGGGGGAGDDVGQGGIGYAGGGTGSPGTLTAGGANGGGHCAGGNDGGSPGVKGGDSSRCDAQPGATGGAPGKYMVSNGNSISYETIGTLLGPFS